jgi:hypothetical protein
VRLTRSEPYARIRLPEPTEGWRINKKEGRRTHKHRGYPGPPHYRRLNFFIL